MKSSARLLQPLIEALSQFWRLRNMVVSRSERIDEMSLFPAIEDGMRLLSTLGSIRIAPGDNGSTEPQ